MTRRTTRRWLLLGTVVAVVTFLLRHPANHDVLQGTKPLPNFGLQGTDGTRIMLHDYASRAGLVLIFLGNDCPNSNKSIPRLVQLAQVYEPRGISFLGVNSNASQSITDVANHARKFQISFPVGKDSHNIVADLAAVERTCEVVLLDARGSIRYHGAIDDQFGRGISKPHPTQNYLTDALDAVLAGRPVKIAATQAIGCPIERIPRPSTRVRPAAQAIVAALEVQSKRERPVEVGPLTYAADIAPIIQNRCQSCHRVGQEAPFELLTYEDARSRAAVIGEVVADRRMPPWHADPRYGHFSNDRSLTSLERAKLLAWIDQGTPEGGSAQQPHPRVFPEGWSIGTPDVVFEIPEPNEVPAIGVLDYVIIHVPTHFQQDMWVQAAEIRPEVRSVVHHIIVQILDPASGQTDHGDHLATYVPGDAPTSYPPGVAKRIPRGAQLKFGIHYTPDGIARSDRSKIGLTFARGPVRHQAFTRSVENTAFTIPPHAAAHPVRSTYTTDSPLRILSFAPHMHVRGKDFLYTATYPDGRTETLLSVPAYDFGWQSSYILSEPKLIPAGTRIDCLAHYDNSTANPANPDPSQTVVWGEQSFEEMMIGYFDYIVDLPAQPLP